MEKELIVDVRQDVVNIALLENHRLMEYSSETLKGRKYSVGDVYIGRVKKLLPSLNAAFVDIGDEKDAFIHYLDLGMNFRAFDRFVQQIDKKVSDTKAFYQKFRNDEVLPKDGKIQDYLTVGMPIMVQIVKEPISTKGSRLTSEISIAGRNMVLLPFNDKVSISQKITSKTERKRLERLVYSILPENYGVIIRTAAEGKRAAVLDAELRSLVEKWEGSWDILRASKAVGLLFTENNRVTTILRDLLNDSFNNIYANDESVCNEIHDYISMISPEQEKIVHLYDSRTPIFDHFDITRQIKGSFGKVVSMKKGTYLVIEHTEALHVIDVNSGIRHTQVNQEENALEVNLFAAEEIARQMRLRDMGGIIIVDFIDMNSPEHRNELFLKMQEFMAADRTTHTVLPLTKFGLMQITRLKVRPVTRIDTSEVCPACHGTGKVSSTLVFDEQLENQLEMLVKDRGYKSLRLTVSPMVHAYLTKGFNSIRRRWSKKYGCTLRIVPDSEMHLIDCGWADDKGLDITI
ncbi:MAG: Rne/Rng family ribonuclease [Bacteroidales bacterium]|nr:Rne/Rng family ribonuclease [Bacteroidales bacterium]